MARKSIRDSLVLNPERLDSEVGELYLTEFSWSRLDKYKWCPKQYKLSYCDMHPTGWTSPLALGSAVHEALENAVKFGVEDKTEVVGFLIQAIEKNDPDKQLSDDDISQARIQVTEVFDRMQESANGVGNIVDVEWGFRYIIGRGLFTGFVDVIAYDEDEQGEFIHILDYKSGKRGKKKTKTHGQTKLYTLAVMKRFPGMRIKASLYWTKENYVDTYEYSTQELIEFEEWAIKEVNDIIEDDSYNVTKDVFKCAYCDYATDELCKYGVGCAKRFNNMRRAKAAKI